VMLSPRMTIRFFPPFAFCAVAGNSAETVITSSQNAKVFQDVIFFRLQPEP
jgi:hypothetical protein